jgi:antitoxin component of MazEF toxin-antitoxin module
MVKTAKTELSFIRTVRTVGNSLGITIPSEIRKSGLVEAGSTYQVIVKEIESRED